MIQEAEFQTIASETAHGLSGNVENETTASTEARNRYQHTFFGETKGNRDVKKLLCKVCGSSHGAWNCAKFYHSSLPDRWDTAKDLKLCFRCLRDNHFGRSCPRSRQCGQNGCKELHHKLLHRSESAKPNRPSSDETMIKQIGNSWENANLPEQPVSSTTEGKASSEVMTMVTQNHSRADYVGLRTVPVVLKNEDRWMTAIALLDDASTKTYINTDVATELGLKGNKEQVTINVLNGQLETFETMPVNFELESVNGNVNASVNGDVKVSAYTTNRVTGNMTVVDWNRYKAQWPHLKNVNFQQSPTRPIVDILLGLDCAELHYAYEEVRGRPVEPFARLTPLGWTCIGNPDPLYTNVLQTNFAYTNFIKDVPETGLTSQNLKFWERESTCASLEPPIVSTEEKLALKKQMHREVMTWKSRECKKPNKDKLVFHGSQSRKRSWSKKRSDSRKRSSSRKRSCSKKRSDSRKRSSLR